MRAVMYHYVRGETDRPPSGYYHLDVDDFRAQLDYLERERRFLSREQFRACLRGEQSPPADGVVLTFDDGLADHYEWVLPELRSRGLWGIFFVPTAPLAYGCRLPVHRIHTLVSEYPGSDLLEFLQEIIRSQDISIPSDVRNMYADRETADSVRQFKHLLNRGVPYHTLSAVLDQLELAFPSARTTADELYMSGPEVRELSTAGMVVGAHTVTHPVLSTLPVAAQRWEIRQSRRHLETILDEPVDLFAYPYGGPESYSSRTVDIVRSADFEGAVTTVDGDVPTGTVAEPLTLPRRDCAALDHGDSSFAFPSAD